MTAWTGSAWWRNSQGVKPALVVWATLGCVPLVVYSVLLFRYMANVPYLDDYYDNLFTLLLLRDAHSLTAFWDAISWQYHQHLMLYNRVLYLVYRLFTDQMDFRHMMWIGNASLLAFWVILCTRIRNAAWYLVFCLSAMLFNLYHEGLSFFPVAATLQIGIMFYSFLVFFWLDRDPPRLVAASVLTAVMVLTQSNEMLLLGLGWLILLSSPVTGRIRFLSASVIRWSVASGITLMVFLLVNRVGMDMPRDPTIPVVHGMEWVRSVLQSFFASLVSLPYTVGDDMRVPAVFGVLHFVLLLFFVFRGWPHEKAVVAMMLFCLLSLLSASVMRTPVYGPSAYVERYKIYCSTLICCEMLLGAVFWGKNRWFAAACVVLAVVVNFHGFYKNHDYVANNKNFKDNRMLEWFYNNHIQEMPFASSILGEAYETGIYHAGKDTGEPVLPLSMARVVDCPSVTRNVVSTEITVRSAPASYGVAFTAPVPLTTTLPDTLWLCGPQSYMIERNRETISALPSERGRVVFLLLEKRDITQGHYRVLAKDDTGVYPVAGTVMAPRESHQLPSDCFRDADTVSKLVPLIYQRYCAAN